MTRPMHRAMACARWRGATATIVLVGVLAGCAATSIEPGTETNPRTVQVAALDSFAFEPAQISLRAGETVRFVVTNEGALEHEFVIGNREGLREHGMTMIHGGMREDSSAAIRVIPGETKELVYTFGAESDIGYACRVAGHYPAGMSGSFLVLQ